MLRHGSRIAHAIFGPHDFWAQVKSLMDLARLDGRVYPAWDTMATGRRIRIEAPWLTYEEWEHLFGVAIEQGIMAVHGDEAGVARPEFANPAAMGLLRFWRAMRDARAKGIEARQFALRYDAMIESDHDARRRAVAEEERRAAERRERATDELRGRRNDKRTIRGAQGEAMP